MRSIQNEFKFSLLLLLFHWTLLVTLISIQLLNKNLFDNNENSNCFLCFFIVLVIVSRISDWKINQYPMKSMKMQVWRGSTRVISSFTVGVCCIHFLVPIIVRMDFNQRSQCFRKLKCLFISAIVRGK